MAIMPNPKACTGPKHTIHNSLHLSITIIGYQISLRHLRCGDLDTIRLRNHTMDLQAS
jgi:hypothetical protein